MKKKSFVIFLISLIILGGIAYYGYTILNAFQATVDNSISGTDLASGNKIEQKVPGEIMFLMAGIDENSDEEAKGSMARTDTLMLIKANYNTGEVNIISVRSEEHTSELQSRFELVCRLLLEKKKKQKK